MRYAPYYLSPNTWYRLPTIPAFSSLHMGLSDHIPRPPDDHFLALGTEGVLTLVARYIPDVDIFKTGGQSHCPCFLNRRYRCRRKIPELIQRIEAGKMDRSIRAQLILDP